MVRIVFQYKGKSVENEQIKERSMKETKIWLKEIIIKLLGSFDPSSNYNVRVCEKGVKPTESPLFVDDEWDRNTVLDFCVVNEWESDSIVEFY